MVILLIFRKTHQPCHRVTQTWVVTLHVQYIYDIAFSILLWQPRKWNWMPIAKLRAKLSLTAILKMAATETTNFWYIIINLMIQSWKSLKLYFHMNLAKIWRFYGMESLNELDIEFVIHVIRLEHKGTLRLLQQPPSQVKRSLLFTIIFNKDLHQINVKFYSFLLYFP